MTDALARSDRRRAVNDYKRAMILEAACSVFERDGLEGASLRAIAKEAGYTPAALYFHYASKEAIYADLIAASLERLDGAVAAAMAQAASPRERLVKGALAFFDYYSANPRDLELGFYLFRGMRPRGLSPELDRALNERLSAVLGRLETEFRALGIEPDAARRETTALFAHSVGVLLMIHTGRIRMFGVDGGKLMRIYLERATAGSQRTE